MPLSTDLVQEHFTIIEIDLPSITGTCTLPDGSGSGFGTPPTCSETWNGTDFETYIFATKNTPLEFGHPPLSPATGAIILTADVHRVVEFGSITQQPTRLRIGQGLAARGRLSVTLQDFIGDPGPQFPVDTPEGTFLGKLDARNIVTNKTIRVSNFSIQADGIYKTSDAEIITYIVDTFTNLGNGKYKLTAKDSLRSLDDDRNQFPAPTTGTLRVAVDNSTTTYPVDATFDWEQLARPYMIRIGSELNKVTAVSGNQTGAAALTVAARGANISFTNFITETTADSHAVGDSIQLCHVSDDERIDDLLEVILLAAGISAAKLPTTDWAAEMDEWQSGVRIDTVFHDPKPAGKVAVEVLTNYTTEMWDDPISDTVKIAAISVWQTSEGSLTQGEEIISNSLRWTNKDELRFNEAAVLRDKPDKIKNNDVENFRALSVSTSPALQADGFYGDVKAKFFRPSHMVDETSGDLMVQRQVGRFGETPREYSWRTPERFLTFEVGDVRQIDSREEQDIFGAFKEVRAQVTEIATRYTKHGREYRCRALSYQPAFADDTEFTIDINSSDVNIHTFVGAPPAAVNVTIIIDGAIISSSEVAVTALRAGPFATGSMITIIFKDSAQLQSAAGKGGAGGLSFIEFGEPLINGPGGDGEEGGIAYDAQGIDTDIHLGGTIGSHTALGTVRAPGGGGGGEDGQGVDPNTTGGDGGGGGAGIVVGAGGPGGLASDPDSLGTATQGVPGSPGDTVGNGGAAGGAGAGAGGDWGVAGSAGDGSGGAAGAGLIKSGATVNIHTDGNTGRFTNGSGDAPDVLD